MAIKKVLYNLLKEIKAGNKVTAKSLGITIEELATVVEYAKEKNYIKNGVILRGGEGNKTLAIALENASITFEGEMFLEKNSSSND